MKTLLILFLIFGFLIGTALGVFMMGRGMDGHMNNCLASLVRGVLCPQFATLLDSISFHLGVFNFFSLAVIRPAFAIFIFFAVLILFALRSAILRSKNIAAKYLGLFEAIIGALSKQHMTHWLALLEKRDPSLSL